MATSQATPTSELLPFADQPANRPTVTVAQRERTDQSDLDRLLAPPPTSALVLGNRPLPVPAKPVDEVATWTAVLKEHDIPVVGIRPEPSRTTRLKVDGQWWRWRRVQPGMVVKAPPTVVARYHAATRAGVPFRYWLVEEVPAPVKAQPRPQPQPTSRYIDPILYGCIRLSSGLSLFASLGAWNH